MLKHQQTHHNVLLYYLNLVLEVEIIDVLE
jgi:hypothetical protein